ncbi:MAG: MgtC/SapB family protein [Candidatus Micrarchaeota archaeon]|nr:MgtC/SapB family protein [Candidatus Micrarchaeota archaeon]
MLPDSEIVLRLLLAFVLGGLIGYEREAIKKPAGLRTHILVAIGSALVTVTGIALFGENDSAARIASGIVTGIGFLGAGTIMRSEDGVHGLTTAASMWVVAAVGMAVGFGLHTAAAFATLLVLAVLQLKSFEPMIVKKNRHEK